MENGLNLYDYDARQMDVASGRFTSVDPMAEKYYIWSPYTYCLGNPMKFVDPSGMLASPYYTRDGDFLGVDEQGFTGVIYITDEETFEKHSDSDGVADSEDIQKDENTVSIKDSYLEASVQSRIYTNVLNKAADPLFDMTRLYKGKISIIEKVVLRNGKIVGLGFNDPYGHTRKPKYSSTKVGEEIRITVEFGYQNSDLYTVESIQNYLGVHEYYGHGVMNWSQENTHWKCYEAQKNHPTYKKLPKYQQNEINNRYFMFRKKQ